MRTINRWAVVGLWLGLLGTATLAAGRDGPILEADAVLGEPFGVGRLVVDLPPAMLPQPLGIEGLGVMEKSGRVHYPALRSPALAAFMKELLGEAVPLTSGGPIGNEVGGILRDILNRPPRTTIYFLFRGEATLEMTLQARRPVPLTVRPIRMPMRHRVWLQEWWREYSAARPLLLQRKPDYPPLVETFLVNTLARRMNLRLPPAKIDNSARAQFAHELGVLTGAESIRTAIEQDRVLGTNALDQPADQPLPTAQPPLLAIPEPPAGVKVEPIAMRVPVECFYVRFGSFDNFLWFQDTLATWGGDLQNLVALRGLDYGRSRRFEEQLVLKQTELSRLLGGTVISDVAILGTDMLFEDGAAYGLLFQARNNMLLGADMSNQRSERVKKGGVTEDTVEIGGRQVSYLWSPDGAVRSYYAVDGDYHFITTSKALAARFLQTAKGPGSLGASKEFRHARNLMSVTREDTVFAYLSEAFFRNITSPRYRTEMLRRMEAATDIEVVQLAKLAAAAEDKPGGTIDELIAGGMLPPGFGRRPDGSQPVLAAGSVHDGLRGWKGSFIPVPDTPVEKVTRAEADAYNEFARFARENWGPLEPILAGIRRKALPKKQEQVVLDVRMTPLSRRRVEMVQLVAGVADPQRLVPLAEDTARFEAVLKGQRMFGGLRDVLPPNEIFDARFLPWLKFRDALVGYLGNEGDPGLLGLLDATFLAPPDPNGYAQNPLGLWRLQSNRFTLYSFQNDVLAGVAPQLRFEQAPRPAQLRLHVGDVSRARITPFVNNLGYARTRETALGNVRLLHSLGQQLHVPPKGRRQAAEFLLAAKMVCPLGGDYVLREAAGEVPRWTSTKLEQMPAPSGPLPQAPEGYVAPPLSWFRGLDLDAALFGDALSAHADVIMQLPSGK